MDKPIIISAKCPDCGAKLEVNKNLQEGQCNYCGAKILIKDLVQSVVIKGKVKVDKTDNISNWYVLARRAAGNNDFYQAYKYYDMILQEIPDDWEAYFYTTYYKAMGCKIIEIEVATASICNCSDNVFELIRDNLTEKQAEEAVKEVSFHIMNLCTQLLESARNHYKGIDSEIRSRYTDDYVARGSNCYETVYNVGDLIDIMFGENINLVPIKLAAWKQGIELQKKVIPYSLNRNKEHKILKTYVKKIRTFETTYRVKKSIVNGCYVATSVYGSYDCPEVWTLRRFRDEYLDNHFLGRIFIKTYYKVSPTMIKIFGKTKSFKKVNKIILDKLVNGLNNKGYGNTRYNDKY